MNRLLAISVSTAILAISFVTQAQASIDPDGTWHIDRRSLPVMSLLKLTTDAGPQPNVLLRTNANADAFSVQGASLYDSETGMTSYNYDYYFHNYGAFNRWDFDLRDSNGHFGGYVDWYRGESTAQGSFHDIVVRVNDDRYEIQFSTDSDGNLTNIWHESSLKRNAPLPSWSLALHAQPSDRSCIYQISDSGKASCMKEKAAKNLLGATRDGAIPAQILMRGMQLAGFWSKAAAKFKVAASNFKAVCRGIGSLPIDKKVLYAVLTVGVIGGALACVGASGGTATVGCYVAAYATAGALGLQLGKEGAEQARHPAEDNLRLLGGAMACYDAMVCLMGAIVPCSDLDHCWYRIL